jgi:serine/threonine-protein kinase
LLNGGKDLLFTITQTVGPERWDQGQIVVQSLRSGERKVIVRGGSDGRYVPTGHLIYALGGTLFAIPFDASTLQVKGGPVPVIEGVLRVRNPAGSGGAANVAFAANGALFYMPGPVSAASAPTVLAFVDRSGRQQPLALPALPYIHPRISPDGKTLVVGSDDGKEATVWVYDLSGGSTPRRLTFEGRNRYPIWTPDSRYITFQSDRAGDFGIFRQLADGTGPAERLTKPERGTQHEPEAWSPDGRTLSFNMVRAGNQGVWIVALEGDRKPAPFVDDPIMVEKHSVFSPDGRWLAYMSAANSGGTTEVFVQPFPATGAKYQVSTGSGRTPLWSPDGRQLLYHHPGSNRLLTVDVRTGSGFAVGTPAPLPIEGTVHPVQQRNYDITPDGKQFLVALPALADRTVSGVVASRAQINVVLNWFEELKARVPAK